MKINNYKNNGGHELNHDDERYKKIRKSLYGFRDGKKITYFRDGNRYEGNFKNNLRDGKGIFYYNNYRYEGDWKNDKKEREYIIIIMAIDMKENGKMIKEKEKV